MSSLDRAHVAPIDATTRADRDAAAVRYLQARRGDDWQLLGRILGVVAHPRRQPGACLGCGTRTGVGLGGWCGDCSGAAR